MVQLKSETALPLVSDLDPSLGSLSKQVARQVRAAIISGRLRPGDRLPASRAWARELGVARGTLTTALEVLTAEGVLEARVGAGTFVTQAAPPPEGPPPETKAPPPPRVLPFPAIDAAASEGIDLRPCRPCVEDFPIDLWRRCLGLAAHTLPSPDYGDPRGEPELREEIATHLRRARGLSAHVDEIIVTHGAVHAMHLLASLYLSASSSVVFEEPGYPLARQIFTLTGAQIHLCEVDEHGLRTEQLPRGEPNVDLAYVTPSHQFPMGGRLSLARRRDLIAWATQASCIIVEDDYDGEFRYDVAPLAPLASLAPHTVVYCGTFSKTMFPGLRLGFAVAPRPIVEAMAALRATAEYAPSTPLQRALTFFLREGHYARHVHRMRRKYAQRRRVVAEVLDGLRAPAALLGLDSGLSVCLRLSSPCARALSAAARSRGVLIPTLDTYRSRPSDEDATLVCGYAASSPEALERGLHLVFS